MTVPMLPTLFDTYAAPIRKRKDYLDLAAKLGEAITVLGRMSVDPRAGYQAEMETCQEVSMAAYKLMKYLEKNAWVKEE